MALLRRPRKAYAHWEYSAIYHRAVASLRQCCEGAAVVVQHSVLLACSLH